MLARKQSEQAQVDLDVGIRPLQSAQRQNSLASRGQPRILGRQPRKLQRRVGLDGRAQLRRAVLINIEAAVRQLPRQNRADRFIDQRSRRRIPLAAFGRMPPQFQQNEIRFERRIRRQVGPPVAFRLLDAEQIVDRATIRLRASGHLCVGKLEARTHTRVMVCNCTVRPSSCGKLKRTSSSLISISSSWSNPRPCSDSINVSTRFSGAEAPAVTATVCFPSSQSGFTSLKSSIRYAGTPIFSQTSTRRREFELFCEPTTSSKWHNGTTAFTASWRFSVA